MDILQLNLTPRSIPNMSHHIQSLDRMTLQKLRQQTLRCRVRIVKGPQPHSIVEAEPPSVGVNVRGASSAGETAKREGKIR
mmetsp:Transcript_1740/g.3663  ORF Transcript_1740/g.3663 Transcript_1740/m.3663 type:complete len:81 (-) Transcript_1740:465-707(-)